MAKMRERRVLIDLGDGNREFNLWVTVVCDDETSDSDAHKIALYKLNQELKKNNNCVDTLKKNVNDSVSLFLESEAG